jgi:N-acetylglucosamine kinase-like BadF-type ATPase
VNAVFVGVDSGGTRTNVEVLVGDTGARKQYEIGDSLSGALATEEYDTCLRAILAPLEKHCDSLGVSNLSIFIFISAAAYTPWVRDHLVHTIKEVCPAIAGPRLVAAGVANDSVTLLMGLQADGVVIAGTGSNVVIKSATGLRQVGGHEWVACDAGSGFWIGLRAIRQAYRDFEDDDNSVLLQRFRQLHAIRPDDDNRLLSVLRELSIARADMKKEVARFAADVCGAAERGDPAAQDIVKAEAEELADTLAGGLRRALSLRDLAAGIKVVQCGGVLGSEFYRSAFETQVEMRLRSESPLRADVRWQRVPTAVEAAVNLAKSLRESTDDILALANAFRPAVVRFS